MVGTTVAHYSILEKLGEGGMGVVYKAQDTKLDRFVALKFLTKTAGVTEEDRRRFLQEARSAATLNHPNICTVYDVSESDGQSFIAMEFIDGTTLRDRQNNISYKQSIEIGIQVAEGLAAAHEKGIVHRDIKPENIMLRKDGLVQIMDFGLARQQGASRLTREGNTVGTIGYMSPEQVQGLSVDHRSDIFSFGVLLYELFSGNSPFKGMHETAIIYEIVNVDPEPVSILKPELPPELDAILLECLAKEPDERYQSSKEIVKDLRKLKRESSRQTASRILAVRQSRVGPPPASGTRTAEFETVTSSAPAGRSRWMYAALALALLLIGTVAFFMLSRPAPELLRVAFESGPGTTFNTTNGGHLEISPDGLSVVFVATDSLGNDMLWVRQLASAVAIPLTGSANATYPFWSTDSRMIAFFADGKLKKIDAKGGPTFTICDAPSGRGGAWNRNGTIIFAPVSNGPLQQVSAAGGMPKPLTALDTTESEVNHRWPSFLPDGEHFLYSCQTTKASLDEDAEQIRFGSLTHGNGPVVVRATSNAVYQDGFLFYFKQNTLLAQPFDAGAGTTSGDPAPIIENVLYSRVRSKAAFTFSNNGRMVYLGGTNANDEVAMFSTGGLLVQRHRTRSDATYCTFSRDGKYYAYDDYDEAAKNTDLWIHDIARNSDTRLTFSKGVDVVPAWSPDGSKIYFSSNRTGTHSIYVKNSNGIGEEELVYATNSPSYATDISTDGRSMLISTQMQGLPKWDIGILDIPSKTYRPLLTSEFNEWIGNFSPDGKFFCYQSNETGRYEIYIRPTDGSSSRWQVTTNGGENPMWTASGREILYHIGNQQVASTAVAISGGQILVGQSRILFKIDAGYQTSIYNFTRDGKFMLAVRSLNAQLMKNASLVLHWQQLTSAR